MSGTPSEDRPLTGVVLAGGNSRRFGESDKALARIGGDPLLLRVVARLGEVVETVVVSCRSDQRDPFEATLESTAVPVQFVEDPTADCGPLFGFRTALENVETHRCVLATCDTPFLDPRTLADLVGRLEAGFDAVAVWTADGRLQPSQAAYRTAPTVSACDHLFDSGQRRLVALFNRLDSLAVPVDRVDGNATVSLFDVDTPTDYAQAVERSEKRVTPNGTGTPSR